MPSRARRRTSKRVYPVARRGRRGGKINWGKVWGKVKRFGHKANKFLKKSKLISTAAPLFGPYGEAAGAIAGRVGYGKRRMVRRPRRRGRGINTPGGGIRLAGRSGRGKKKTYGSRGMSY
jgi:hypothetical protein